MQKITFITGNANKLKEARAILGKFDVISRAIDLPEIQEVDAKKIIAAKLDEAYKLHKDSYIVEDTSLYIDSLNGLPGPLIKWFLQTLDRDGIAELANKYPDQAAHASCMIGYIDEAGEKHFFEGRAKGKIVSPRGETDFGWDPIFQPEGFDKTFAEMTPKEKNSISHRKIALTKLSEFLISN